MFCTICLTTRKDNQEWFLMVENRWTDRLKVLRWHEELASDPACRAACCVAHVQQLVIHWMTTGTLDYPFARTQAYPDSVTTPQVVHLLALKEEPDTSGAEVLGELAVHRESMSRILVECPYSLGAILSALKDTLPAQLDHSEMAEQEAPECDAYALSEA